ncbi:MAG: glycosyltransferase [Gemmatimonadaceae bacterium]
MNDTQRLKVAIVHEWLVTLGGSELVLRELLRIFPDAHVFTLVDKMPPDTRAFLGVRDTTASFLNRLPGSETRYRSFLPLFPAAIRSLDVSGYDLVISNSHAVAKGVRTRPEQLHICYCLSPMRYAWDLREQYLRESGISTGIKGFLARTLLRSLRRWDRRTSSGVDVFVTLSDYIEDRIRRAYNRDSTVIYPPVDTEFFSPNPDAGATHGDYYVTASRFVPYKRIDLIAAAFAELPGRSLVIVGSGPDDAKIRAAAGSNVTLVGQASRHGLRDRLRGADAFIFAADEDFGIAPVEAQACGIPVIAYGRGGVLETVRGLDSGSPTGVFYREQTVASLVGGIKEFETRREVFSASACRTNADRFSEARFRSEFASLVEAEWQRHARQASFARF